jgi:HEPN domain-containing protein
MDKDEEFYQWFEISAKDLWIAKHLLTTLNPTPDEIICFLCQQSTEKSLKGFLCFNNIKFDKIHDLSQLLGKCISVNTEFKNYAKQCTFLSKYAVMPRYPNEVLISDDDAQSAFRFAKSINEFVLSKVVLPLKPKRRLE